MVIGQDEEEMRQWDRFWGSGSVEDYLRYKGCQEEKIREDSIGHAGFFRGDGDCVKVDSCG